MKLPMKPHRGNGFLFTLCGLDGSGKSTQIERLEDYLEKVSSRVFVTKQPTDSVRRSEMFRTYMDQAEHDAYEYRALSLLCASDRVQHASKEIIPRLEEGFVVVSDRYYYSCLANLLARGYTEDQWIYDVAEYIPKPDGAFFLDADVETAIKRVRRRADERERYIDIGLQHKLKDLYIQIAKANDGTVIGADMDQEQCFEIIKKTVEEVMTHV